MLIGQKIPEFIYKKCRIFWPRFRIPTTLQISGRACVSRSVARCYVLRRRKRKRFSGVLVLFKDERGWSFPSHNAFEQLLWSSALRKSRNLRVRSLCRAPRCLRPASGFTYVEGYYSSSQVAGLSVGSCFWKWLKPACLDLLKLPRRIRRPSRGAISAHLICPKHV